ncbi:MAG TPA: Xaa-Pro peptidase family protein, partial [Chroococcales cyanobacterium]
MKSVFQGRIEKLRKVLFEKKLDGIFLSNLKNIRYLTGFSGSTAKAVITADQALLIIDFRYFTQAAEQAPHMEVFKVEASDYRAAYQGAIAKSKVKVLGFEGDNLTFDDFEKLRTGSPTVDWMDAPNLVEPLRTIKDPGEAESIKKACRITSRALAETLDIIKPGMTELDVLAELEYRMRKGGGGNLAFDTIVASGVRSSMPHASASEKVIEEGDFVTIDCGSSFGDYCADTTRTVVIGEPDTKQREVWNAVRVAMEMGIKAVKPGISCREVDGISRNYLASLGFGEYFGHGLGHGVGLEVHEEPRLSVRSEEILQAGMIVTVEPGVYI